MGGGGSSSKNLKSASWNVNDFNLTGSEKQIKYAKDLIQREYDGIKNGEEQYRKQADEYIKKGKADIAKRHTEQADDYMYAAKWANTELKKLSRITHKAGDIIDTLTRGYRKPAKEFDLYTRWKNGEDAKYYRTHKTKYSHLYK